MNTYIRDVAKIIAINGRVKGYPPHYEKGITITPSSYTNPILYIQTDNLDERHKRNLYLQLAGDLDADYVLIIDSDEYITGDWRSFENSIKETVPFTSDQIFNIWFVNQGEYDQLQPVLKPRLIRNPKYVRYGKNHYSFVTTTQSHWDKPKLLEAHHSIDGIQIIHAKQTVRTPEELKNIKEYQDRLKELEE